MLFRPKGLSFVCSYHKTFLLKESDLAASSVIHTFRFELWSRYLFLFWFHLSPRWCQTCFSVDSDTGIRLRSSGFLNIQTNFLSSEGNSLRSKDPKHTPYLALERLKQRILHFQNNPRDSWKMHLLNLLFRWSRLILPRMDKYPDSW